jgi:uncharacterized membrane protein YraQ (UPF0718 family)
MSLGTSLAYLIAVPFTSFSMIFVIISLFGLDNAMSLLFTILFIAFVTGVFADVLQYYKVFPRNEILSRRNPSFDVLANIQEDKIRFIKILKNYKKLLFHLREILSDIISIATVISKWALLGILLGGLIAGGLKENEIVFMFGDSVLAEFITLVLSAVIELFAEGLLVFAFLLFHMTGALGSVLVFLIGAVVFDFVETGVLKKVLGLKITLYFCFIPSLLAVVFGFVLN